MVSCVNLARQVKTSSVGWSNHTTRSGVLHLAKPQISSLEVFSIIVSLFLGLTSYNAAPIMVRGAGQGVWLSILVAGLVALCFGYSFYFLQRRLPGQTYFEQALQVLGPVIGRAFILLWSIMYLHAVAVSIRNLTAFFRIFMPQTPNGAFVILFVLVAAAGASLGLEVILRSGIVLTAMAVLIIWVSMALLLNKADPGNLLPLLPSGPVPAVITAASIIPWFNLSAILGVLFAYHPHPARAWRAHVMGTITSCVTMVVQLLITVATLNPYFAATQQAPVYSATRLVEVGRFIENLELLLVAANVASGLISCAVLLYTARVGVGLLFGVRNAPSLSWPLGAIVGIFTLSMATSRVEVSEFLARVLPVYGTLVPFGLILVLILAVVLRKDRRHHPKKGDR